ncbi:MAG: vanadium-dependent haloperoxidase [Bacillota bacterium]|nr:vanadium-dependent haloperoxidase [Bacillota bacterium]
MKYKPDILFPDHCTLPKINVPRCWSMLSYAGEERVPAAVEPAAGSWPTYYLRREQEGRFTDLQGNPIAFRIRQPEASIDFTGEQLEIVKEVLENLTQEQIEIAIYWGTGPPTKQFTPIIDILIDTYKVSAPQAARILAVTQAALNDTMMVVWYYKYLWNIARPNQLDQTLETVLPTPKHPSYPSGHSTVAGCAQVVLSYFFKPEAARLKELAEECAVSRLYAGVHFPVDNDEGLRLGRQIGSIVVDQLKKEFDKDMTHIDIPYTENLHAKLPPPPYKQVIPCK